MLQQIYMPVVSTNAFDTGAIIRSNRSVEIIFPISTKRSYDHCWFKK